MKILQTVQDLLLLLNHRRYALPNKSRQLGNEEDCFCPDPSPAKLSVGCKSSLITCYWPWSRHNREGGGGAFEETNDETEIVVEYDFLYKSIYFLLPSPNFSFGFHICKIEKCK